MRPLRGEIGEQNENQIFTSSVMNILVKNISYRSCIWGNEKIHNSTFAYPFLLFQNVNHIYVRPLGGKTWKKNENRLFTS